MKALGFFTIVQASRTDEFTVWNLSDLHIGAKACAEDKIKRDVRRIAADKNAVWFGGGDTIDAIGYTDKRFSPGCIAPWIRVKDMGNLGEVCVSRAIDLLSPIKHKCLGMMMGNHEASLMLHTQAGELHASMCKRLGVMDMGFSCIWDLRFTRASSSFFSENKFKTPHMLGWNVTTGSSGLRPSKHRPNADLTQTSYGTRSFRFYCHHGAGGAVTKGGKLNRLISFMNMVDADIIMMGHVHDQQGSRQNILTANASCDDIQTREKVGVVSGSYLKTYQHDSTTYGEIKGYQPTVLGASFVRIKPETREIRGEI